MTKKKSTGTTENVEAEAVEAAKAVENVSDSDTRALAENASEDLDAAVKKLSNTVSATETSFEKANGAFAEAAKAMKKFIYLGATLPNNALKSNTVFDGEFEEICGYLQAEIKLYPIVKELIVPVEHLTSAKSSMRIKSLQSQLIKSFERGK